MCNDSVTVNFRMEQLPVMNVVWEVWKRRTIATHLDDFRHDWEAGIISLIVPVDLLRAALLEAGLYTEQNRLRPRS